MSITIYLVFVLSPNLANALTIGGWIETSQFPSTQGIASQYVFEKNNLIYSLGGAGSSTFNSGSYVGINNNGLLTNWVELSSKPNRFWHTGANYNNYVYLLGGADQNTIHTNSVIFGHIENDGDINNWVTTTQLPYALVLGSSLVYSNRIYYAGGSIDHEKGSSAKSEIYMAEINQNGTLGNWSIAGYLPEPLLGFGMVEHNGYLIVIGGKNSQDEIITSVRKAKINLTTGSIEAWTELPELPNPAYRASTNIVNKNIIVSGGYYTKPVFTLTDNIYYSPIDLSANFSSWLSSMNKLPIPLCCHSQTYWNNYLYIIGGWSNGYLSNSYVSELTDTTPLPSATATPTTTPTATATATATATSTPTTTATAIPYINLDVPSLKQFTSPWGSQKYAHTNWTITNYGCALTSATMVLKYHGHKTNPEDLNKWLRNQPDGYLKGSLLNWLAVSRYSKLNDSFLSPTLEFNKFIFVDQVVKDSLNQGLPLISKVPGHFVVIKGMEDNEFTINDPGYNNRNNLSYYPDRDYLIKYTPTHSDLSYIMAVVQGNKTITLLDTENNEIAHSYIETPIKDLYSDNLSPSTPYSVLYFQKPETGKYKLKVNGQGQYNLDLYYYYKDGDFKKNNLIGNLKKNQTNNYEITYFKNGDIENLFNKLINQTKGNKIANTYLKTAYKLYNRNLNKPVLVLLNNLKRATYKGFFSDIREDLSALISLLSNK